MSKITMKDIAKIAGVSQPTVSRVINGNKTVDEAIRQKVLSVIQETGYTPNKAAQALKIKKTKTIGVLIPDVKNLYYIDILDYIEREANQKGYNFMLAISRDNLIIEKNNLDSFIDRQVDGIIVVPVKDYNKEAFQNASVPLVSATWFVDGVDSVSISHYNAGAQTAHTLFNSGHTKFGCIGAENDNKILGFISGFYDKGFEFEKKNLIKLQDSDHTAFDYKRRIDDYLDNNPNPDFTCILAINDLVALELKKAFQKRGIEDIVIVGFDDTFFSSNNEISSIHQPIEEIAKAAFDLLLSRMKSEITDDTKVKLEYDAVFIKRGDISNRKTI